MSSYVWTIFDKHLEFDYQNHLKHGLKLLKGRVRKLGARVMDGRTRLARTLFRGIPGSGGQPVRSVTASVAHASAATP
jgi:hypothetical protein